MRSDLIVVTFPGYLIIFPPTVRHTQIGSSLCVCKSTTMPNYATVYITGILLPAENQIVFVPFYTFPVNLYVCRSNYFDNTLFHISVFLFFWQH